jgi:hypothetical protein
LAFSLLENRSAGLKVEGAGFVFLFMIGQLSVFISCARAFGLFGF